MRERRRPPWSLEHLTPVGTFPAVPPLLFMQMFDMQGTAAGVLAPCCRSQTGDGSAPACSSFA